MQHKWHVAVELNLIISTSAEALFFCAEGTDRDSKIHALLDQINAAVKRINRYKQADQNQMIKETTITFRGDDNVEAEFIGRTFKLVEGIGCHVCPFNNRLACDLTDDCGWEEVK